MTTEAAPKHVSGAALSALLSAESGNVARVADLLWRGGFTVADSLPQTREGESLLTVLQLAAVCSRETPDLLATAVETAAPVLEEDTDVIHVVATQVLGRPATMRWITNNSARVANSDNWLAAIPGLGGITVSVPLAEEALVALMRRKARVPRDLTAYVQLNPWFSRWFAIRYRRRMKGRRIRVAERGATARGWSHARTILLSSLPSQWQSLLKRGVGRPLDEWSTRLLTDYVATFDKTYVEDGIPPVLATLYVVAVAGIGPNNPSEQLARRWTALPFQEGEAARMLIGLPGSESMFQSETAEVVGLGTAAAALGDDVARWQHFAATAITRRRGFAAAAAEITGPAAQS
jgi:hypothetical protein